MVSLADGSSPTSVEEAEVRKEVDAAHLRDWAKSEFGDDVDTILIEFIEDLSYGIRDPDYDDGSLYSEWNWPSRFSSMSQRRRHQLPRTDRWVRLQGWCRPRVGPLVFCQLRSERHDPGRRRPSQEGLTGWFDAVTEGWERDENVLWALLPAVTPFLTSLTCPRCSGSPASPGRTYRRTLRNLLFGVS